MKRLNKVWWKGNDGYYKEIKPRMWEGPFEEYVEETVTDSDYANPEVSSVEVERVVEVDEQINLTPAKKVVDKP